ncbi:Degenerin mec-4 [Araneus ventricosus]|uniref:Degenerin mec-4 n=1 Tax=Araneus ventricosus TaxID=182803 RepID=A0A4Y2QPJ3_ARAVE|nr:Degenerin mec-4 [Araneus ventricosus]
MGCSTEIRKDETGTPLLFSQLTALNYCKISRNGTESQKKKTFMELRALKDFFELDDEKRERMLHNGMIRGCIFNGKLCPLHIISDYSSYRFGNCVTFNKQTRKRSLKTSETGVRSGLILTLDVQTYRYASVTHTIGALLIIHDPNKIPSEEDQGYIVSPGYETLISLKQTRISRLSAPYRDKCVDYEIQRDFFNNNKYQCIRACIQKQNFERCGCIDLTLGIMNNLNACDLTNRTQACCLDDALEYMSSNSPTCDCPLPCNSVNYNEKMSRSILPQIKMIRYVGPPDQNGRRCIATPGKLRLNVFYSDLETHVYEQRPKWEIAEMLSYFGNELGLWLGVSFATFLVIFEKLVLFLEHVVMYTFR